MYSKFDHTLSKLNVVEEKKGKINIWTKIVFHIITHGFQKIKITCCFGVSFNTIQAQTSTIVLSLLQSRYFWLYERINLGVPYTIKLVVVCEMLLMYFVHGLDAFPASIFKLNNILNLTWSLLINVKIIILIPKH